jgi:hypothetical protein
LPLLAFLAVLAMLGVSDDAFSQQTAPTSAEQGRWVTAGTYALSGFAQNPTREKTYRGAGREKARISIYLPAMTMLYGVGNTVTLNGRQYVDARTQSGIPVSVLLSQISSGDVTALSNRDVVVHQGHDACIYSEDECIGEDEVPKGSSFTIRSETRSRIILENAWGLVVSYTQREFDDLERAGFLTRLQNRIHPRWRIIEGYALPISITCGAELPGGGSTKFEIDAARYEAGPETWAPNDEAWTIKAFELLDLGRVEKVGSNYVATLSEAMPSTDDVNSGQPVAYDFSVFAYKDTDRAEQYKFASILSIMSCEEFTRFTENKPSYVKRLFAYYDVDNDATYPLDEIEFEAQLSETARSELFDRLDRSFFFSINSAQQYRAVFENVTDRLRDPSAASFLISRTNASCAETDREWCSSVDQEVLYSD